jgi:actin-like protein 6A
MLQAVEARGAEVAPRYSFRRAEAAPGVFKVERLDFPATAASFRAYHVEAVAQDIKQAICRVSDAAFDPGENASIPTASYELPDGQEIQVGAARFAVPEVLFNPPLLAEFGAAGAGVAGPAGEPLQGLQAAVAECIGRCDVDARRELYGGVVLTGGTALFASLRDRLERELADAAPAMAKVKVVCPANAVERRYSAWIGGSILASLGTFQQMWMSKAEYQEHGAGLIHKKAT